MRFFRIIIVYNVQLLLSSVCFGQLVADAGSDTAVCSDNLTPLSIGGNPTAKGGVAPYEYAWSGYYRYAGQVFCASYMLEDTTIANPVFREGAIPDSVLLYVNVKDANENTAVDSVLIRQSRYNICLGECRYTINEGEGVQLGLCVSGGIPPVKYLWSPSEYLSDSTSQGPWANPPISMSYQVQIIDSIGCMTTSSCTIIVIPVGVNSQSNIHDIEVYPNPSQKILYVRFNKSDFSKSSFALFSLKGIKVYETLLNNNVVLIDLKDITSGTYIYHCSLNNNQLASGKIIID